MIKVHQAVNLLLNFFGFLFFGFIFTLLFIFFLGWVLNVGMGDMTTSQFNKSFIHGSQKYYYQLPKAVTSPIDSFFRMLATPLNQKKKADEY